MRKIFALLLAVASLCTYTSCKQDKDPQPEAVTPEKSLIGTAQTSDNYTVTLYADTSALVTGYNQLYIQVKDPAGAVSGAASVAIMPMMDMTTMSHSSPYDPVSYDATTQLYTGAVVFTMPTTSDGSWMIRVTVNGSEVSIPVTVSSFATKVISMDMGTDGSTYIVSLVRPRSWVVGMNDVTFTIHKKASMMSFPAVDNLNLEMTPEMPSMGHGSPNNISPVSTGNGYYKGKVNYTMTGDWRLHLKIMEGSTILVSDAYVDILF